MKMDISQDILKNHKGIFMTMGCLYGVDNTIEPRTDEIRAFMLEEFSKVREKYAAENLYTIERISIFRTFYWNSGLDPTKMRPANEALLRRVVGGEGLPQINAVVDLYNVASVSTLLPMCAYDLEKIQGKTLLIDYAHNGEHFFGIGMDSPLELSGKEIIVRDGNGPISLYPYRDAEATKVSIGTRDVLFTVDGVPGITPLELLWALKICLKYVSRFVGGTAEVIL